MHGKFLAYQHLIFSVKDRIDKGGLEVKYCPMYLMIADFFTKPLQDRMFNLFQDLVMGYRPLQDVLIEIPMKEHVGNNKIVNKNKNNEEGALIEISKERTREQTLNRVMSVQKYLNNFNCILMRKRLSIVSKYKQDLVD